MVTYKILSLNTEGHIGRGKDFTASMATAIQLRLKDIEAVLIQETWRTANTRVHCFMDLDYALAGRETEEDLVLANEKRKADVKSQHRINRQLGIAGNDEPAPRWKGTREGIGTRVSPHATAKWDIGITDSLSGRVQASIMRTGRDILVINVYGPPSGHSKQEKDGFRDTIQKIMDMKGSMEAIIMGDWNIDPGQMERSTRWKDMMEKHRLKAIIPKSGTLTSGTSTPDFAVTTPGIQGAEIEVVESQKVGVWGSAHNGITLAWKEQRYYGRSERDVALAIPEVHTWPMKKKEGPVTVSKLNRIKSSDQWEETIRACMGDPVNNRGAKARDKVFGNGVWSELQRTPWTEIDIWEGLTAGLRELAKVYNSFKVE
ncbi:Endonuclease/Exonuclease/phosphatase family [Carpediemonas membranifera]|uniref:Endonuclease/Exonuclease/phosphatase family n=1 Tax=Carpediemonas membranifera TaxID=201153 RepID=A0A8J6ARA9_9EUKA|nr:Endonuclease/Exonuclease/phosphatase family [Carpediemonas membranifera]|eukprot:KAG9389430.1 Endonuclease/Exonuclease/phosphatase family [Carpediemonas membranifera]